MTNEKIRKILGVPDGFCKENYIDQHRNDVEWLNRMAAFIVMGWRPDGNPYEWQEWNPHKDFNQCIELMKKVAQVTAYVVAYYAERDKNRFIIWDDRYAEPYDHHDESSEDYSGGVRCCLVALVMQEEWEAEYDD